MISCSGNGVPVLQRNVSGESHTTGLWDGPSLYRCISIGGLLLVVQVESLFHPPTAILFFLRICGQKAMAYFFTMGFSFGFTQSY